MFNRREEMECLLFCNRESCAIFDRFIADLIYCELHTFFEALSSYIHYIVCRVAICNSFLPPSYAKICHKVWQSYFLKVYKEVSKFKLGPYFMIRFGYDIEFRNFLKFDSIFLTVDDFVFTFIFSVFKNINI